MVISKRVYTKGDLPILVPPSLWSPLWPTPPRETLPTLAGSFVSISCGIAAPFLWVFISVQFSPVTQSCPTLQPRGLQHARLPCPSPTHEFEFTQIHVHRVGDAIQPSHPLSSPSPPAPKSSQNQGLFQWVNSSHEVAKVFKFQLQHQSFQWTPRT